MKKKLPVDLKFQPGQAVTIWDGDEVLARMTVATSDKTGVVLNDGSRWDVSGWRFLPRGALSRPPGSLTPTNLVEEVHHTIAKRIKWSTLDDKTLDAIRFVLEGAGKWPIKDRAVPVAGTRLGDTQGDGWAQKLVEVVAPHLPLAGYLVFTRADDAYGEICVNGFVPTKRDAVAKAVLNTTEWLVGFFGSREGTVYTVWKGAEKRPFAEVNITRPPNAEPR